MATYLSTLGLMWQAVVDVANVMQTIDLFQIGGEAVATECLVPLADLEKLPQLPCCHPSSPLPDPRFKGADGSWPAAIAQPRPGVKEPQIPRIEDGSDQSKRAVRLSANLLLPWLLPCRRFRPRRPPSLSLRQPGSRSAVAWRDSE